MITPLLFLATIGLLIAALVGLWPQQSVSFPVVFVPPIKHPYFESVIQLASNISLSERGLYCYSTLANYGKKQSIQRNTVQQYLTNLNLKVIIGEPIVERTTCEFFYAIPNQITLRRSYSEHLLQTWSSNSLRNHSILQGALCLTHELAHKLWLELRWENEWDYAADSEPQDEAGRWLEICLYGWNVFSGVPVYVQTFDIDKRQLSPSEVSNLVDIAYWKNLPRIPPKPQLPLPEKALNLTMTVTPEYLVVEAHALNNIFLPLSFGPPFFLFAFNLTEQKTHPAYLTFPRQREFLLQQGQSHAYRIKRNYTFNRVHFKAGWLFALPETTNWTGCDGC